LFQNVFATNTAAIKCLVCPETELCPECFAAGAEFLSHKKGSKKNPQSCILVNFSLVKCEPFFQTTLFISFTTIPSTYLKVIGLRGDYFLSFTP
jgi:hypothetical protein